MIERKGDSMLRKPHSVYLAVFLAGVCCPVFAQTTTATLFGVVRDATGALIPQARITAHNVSTSFERTATSDATGAYLITNLPVGQYSLLVEKEGFRRFIQEG